MGRSIWKGPFFELGLYQAIQADTLRKGVVTYSRRSTIIPAFVGAKLLVHNGKALIPVVIREENVGQRVGELALTKKPFSFRATNAGKKGSKK